MPYANQNTVKTLCQNQITNAGDLFTVASSICDSQIDGDLANYFFWPYNPENVQINNPPPAYVLTMANLLTASIIESMSYAQVQGFADVSLDSHGGGGATTYARYIDGTYKRMMRNLIKGFTSVPELVRYSSIGSKQADRKFRLQVGLASDSLTGDQECTPASNEFNPDYDVLPGT